MPFALLMFVVVVVLPVIAAIYTVRKNGPGVRFNEPTLSALLPKGQPFVIPEGRSHLSTYIYDGRPLRNMPDGSRVTLTITPGARSMRSVYTGTKWTETCPLSRNGYLVGFLGSGSNARRVKAVVRKHGYVLVYGRRIRTDRRGWPVIELELPDRTWFESELGE